MLCAIIFHKNRLHLGVMREVLKETRLGEKKEMVFVDKRIPFDYFFSGAQNLTSKMLCDIISCHKVSLDLFINCFDYYDQSSAQVSLVETAVQCSLLEVHQVSDSKPAILKYI